MSALRRDVWALLKATSRSMYLSFQVLPAEVADAMGLGYLLCRAADTLADTRLVPKAGRLKALEAYRAAFDAGPAPKLLLPEDFRRHQADASERELLTRLEDCVALWARFPAPEKQLLREAVSGVVEGMRMDLTLFPGEDESRITALPSAEHLDRYCAHIGGAPGLFWTRLCLLKVPRLRGADAAGLERQGLRLGKGLQMTNILRDMAKDLRIGRCYLPQDELVRAGLSPQALLDPSSLGKLRPVLKRWLAWAGEELGAGAGFIEAMPGFRLRAAAAWPLLLAFKTLALVARAPHLLDLSKEPVRVAQGEVYGMLAGSLWTLPSLPRYRAAVSGLQAELDGALRAL